MSNHSDLEWPRQEMTSERGPTRRDLLAAASGFVLATSGVFLPGEHENALARDGANGGKLGGRRGKDHRGQHKRRNHGDRKDRRQNDKDKAPGSGKFRQNIALYVYNKRTTDASVRGWTGGKVVGYHTTTNFVTIPAMQGSTVHFHDFVFDDTEGTVEIAPDHFAWVTNTYGPINPRLVIARGQWGATGFDRPYTIFVDDHLKVDDQFEGDGILVQRTADTDDLMQFYVTLRLPI